MSLEPVQLRKFIGAVELVVGVSFLIPSLQIITSIIALSIMTSASISHLLLKDPLDAFVVPVIAGLASFFLLQLLLRKESGRGVLKKQ